ncbi:MAG: methylenetetrahydrofolate reductase [Hyphomicrobiales bacterium]
MSRAHSHSQPVVSIEYFPPSGLSAERALITGAHALRRFAPDYQTITFGAGGASSDSVRDVALEWSSQLQNLNEVPTACHLALCHFESSEVLFDFATNLKEEGIERLVVLRGDAQSSSGNGLAGHNSVADAVRALKKKFGFDISVAAYPEPHPKAQSSAADIQVLLDKQAAGANRAITQYFFDNELFYDFCDKARAAGVKMDIVPGIMPIANFEKIKEFSEKCGASVPERFEALFAKAGDDKAARSDVARELVETQVRDLARNGVDQLHIYSLNRVDLTADAIRAFQAEFEGGSVTKFVPAIAS